MVKFSLEKRVSVTFAKDFGAFRKGEKTEVGLVLAAEWVKAKVATLDKGAQAYVAENELGEMFGGKPAED